MATWTEEEFVSRAKMLAKAHAGASTPINDLVEKVAREAELTPDGIRTLGRLTNVAVFQELFQKKASESASDRIVEFEPGDPEVVITRVVQSAQRQAGGQKTAAYAPEPSASGDIPDLMRGERGYCTELEKVAQADEPEERRAPKQMEIMRLRKVAAEIEMGAQAAALRWEEGMAKLARAFRKAPGYGPSYIDFEKAALAEHGLEARAELESLREDLRLPVLTVDSDKVAALADTFAYDDTAELRLFSDVLTHREQYQTLKVAHKQVLTRLASL